MNRLFFFLSIIIFASCGQPEQKSSEAKLLDAGNGSYVASATNRIIKNRNWLIIAPKQAETAQHILIEEGDTKIVFEDGMLELKLIHDSRLTIDAERETSRLAARKTLRA